jgi:phospho-2-dehydro-3-deoxyheptonate aldolase
LRYGVSITDGCISWASTEALIEELAEMLRRSVEERRCASTDSVP